MEKINLKQLFKWFIIGAIILAPGALIALLINASVWWVGLIILIFAQIFAGHLVLTKVSSSLTDMSVNPIKIGLMDKALQLASNEEMIKGYIQWVKDNSATMTQHDAKKHFDNIKKIEESISYIHKYKDR